MTNTFVKIFCWCSYGDVERMLCSETRWWKYSLAYFKWPLPGKLEWCLLYRVICKVVREFSFFLTGWFKSKQFPAGGTTWKGKNLDIQTYTHARIHTLLQLPEQLLYRMQGHFGPCVKLFWRTKHNTIGTFVIQWDVNNWPCYSLALKTAREWKKNFKMNFNAFMILMLSMAVGW